MKKIILISGFLVLTLILAGCSFNDIKKSKTICPDEIVYARNAQSQECLRFVSPCHVPKDWIFCDEDEYEKIPEIGTKQLIDFLDEEDADKDIKKDDEEEGEEQEEEEEQKEPVKEEEEKQEEPTEEKQEEEEKEEPEQPEEGDLAKEEIRIFYLPDSSDCNRTEGVKMEISDKHEYDELNVISTILNTSAPEGYSSAIPSGTGLKDLRIYGNGSAVVKFNASFQSNDDCQKEQSKSQIKQTLLQFPGITSVEIIVVTDEEEITY